MKVFLCALILVASVQALAVVPADVDFQRPIWQRPPLPVYTSPAVPPSGTVTPSCQGVSGNVFQDGYSGMYAAPGGAEIDLWIAAGDLVATVRLSDGRWFEGAIDLGSADRALNIPLTSPTGNTGTLTICATHLTQNVCSRMGAAIIVGSALVSGPQIYTRNRTPVNSPICVP